MRFSMTCQENPYLEGCGCLRLPKEATWTFTVGVQAFRFQGIYIPPGSPSRLFFEWFFRKDDIVLVGIYFINNSRGRTSFYGRLDFQGSSQNSTSPPQKKRTWEAPREIGNKIIFQDQNLHFCWRYHHLFSYSQQPTQGVACLLCSLFQTGTYFWRCMKASVGNMFGTNICSP